MGGFTPVPLTPATLIDGLRSQSDLLGARVMQDMQDQIIFIEPDAAPLTSLVKAHRKRRRVTRYDYEWMLKDPHPREVTVVGAHTSGDTTIQLGTDHGARVQKYSLWINRRTREVVLAASVAVDVVTVTRQIGENASPAAMNDGDILENIGFAFEDGSDLGNLRSTKATREYNYAQIMRRAFGFTGRDENTSLHGGTDPNVERRQQAIEHRKDIEFAAFFGKRDVVTGTGGKLQSMTGGAEYFTKTNIWDVTGIDPTEKQWDEFLEAGMKYGQGGYITGGKAKKYLFYSRRWATKFDNWVKDKARYTVKDTVLGMKINFYQSTHGDVALIPVNIFNGLHAGYAFLLDLNHCRYCFFNNRDTALLDNRGGRGVDGSTEEWRSDCGFQYEEEQAHAMLVGGGSW